MSDEYKHVGGSLKILKPKVAKKANKAKNRHKKLEENKKIQNSESDGNINSQTCWSKVIEIKNLRKKAAFEIKPLCYMKALDNGTIRIGEAHAENEEPDDDEQFVVLPLSFGKFAFKSGFNKYLGLNGTGDVVAIADAVGSFESWEPVIENEKTALCGPNNKFLIEINSHFKCSSAKASEDNFLNIKSTHIETVSNTDEYAEVSENRDQSDDFEKQLILKNTNSKTLKNNSPSYGKVNITDAKKQGNLFEKLLDKREKIKGDKFCK